jgi:hypothetical protein
MIRIWNLVCHCKWIWRSRFVTRRRLMWFIIGFHIFSIEWWCSAKKVKSGKVNSVKEACVNCFAVHLLKFEILQTAWKNKTKNIKMLNLLMKKWKLRVWCSVFHFFMWFARFQISICEPQTIWCKLLALSWL